MIASVLALLVALGPAPDCVRAADEALAQGQVEGAARRGEACFRTGGHAQGLLLASQAWLQAERLAHAHLAARRYLALSAEHERAGRTVAELVAGTAVREGGTVHLTIGPTVAPDEAVTVTARRAGDGEALMLRARWDELIEAGAATLVLDPGAWTVSIARPGYVDAQLEIASAKGQVTTAAADMTRVSRAPARPDERGGGGRAWAIAGPTLGGAGIAVGAALVAVSAREFDDVLKNMSCGTGASLGGCRRPAAIWTEREGAGAAALGAGVGALIAGLTGLAGEEKVRRWLWTSEAIVGGLVAGAGVGVLAYGTSYFVTANGHPLWKSEPVGRGAGLYTTGFGLIGAGVGLAATAVGGLITDALQHRRSRRTSWRIVGGALRF